MNYITVKEASIKWNTTIRTVQNYCSNNKIPGAKNVGKQWLIPSTALKPVDGRNKQVREVNNNYSYHFPVFIYSPYFNNLTELNDEEIQLRQAQILHLEGKFKESILLCNKLLNSFIPTYILFGVHLTIAFNSMLLGLQLEFNNSYLKLETITKKEELHKEDYKLMFNFLKFHVDWDKKAITNIDEKKLSNEAMILYKYAILQNVVITNNTIYKEYIKYLEADLEQYIHEGITPIAFAYHCTIGHLYNVIHDEENTSYHLNNAIDILVKNNWLSHYSKYASVNYILFEKYLKQYNLELSNKLNKIHTTSINNWKLFHNDISKNLLKLYTTNQLDLLLLITYNLSINEIALIRDTNSKEINNQINELIQISNLKNKKELINYSKSIFNIE